MRRLTVKVYETTEPVEFIAWLRSAWAVETTDELGDCVVRFGDREYRLVRPTNVTAEVVYPEAP